MTTKNIYNKIGKLQEEVDLLIEEVEEKKEVIEEHACERDRDMTDKEQERYDELDRQATALEACKEQLDNAAYEIEEWA